MGIVAFQWGHKQLTLVQNRGNSYSWETYPVAWDEQNQILGGLPENNFGTWFGISRRGRVAFLVDALFPTPSALRPVDFLRGEMSSPLDFAMEWFQNHNEAHYNIKGVAYYMILADINSNSMVYIRKPTKDEPVVDTDDVGFGVHTLSSLGLDSKSSEDLRMKNVFREMIDGYKGKELPPPKEMAAKFIYDPLQVDKTYVSSSKEKLQKSHATLSTTALAVKPTKEVKLYERYLENAVWKEHDFTFNIIA